MARAKLHGSDYFFNALHLNYNAVTSDFVARRDIQIIVIVGLGLRGTYSRMLNNDLNAILYTAVQIQDFCRKDSD